MTKEIEMTTHALTTTTAPVLVTTNGGLFKSKFRMHLGRFELTHDRIVYYQKSFFFMMFGALGLLLSRYSPGKRTLDIELSRIASLARGKHGFNKNILDLTLTDGSTHRLSLDRYDDFTAQLRDQLSRRAPLTATGDDKWAVRPSA
jgi:hypothetical protein